jgi:hypothetical protein
MDYNSMCVITLDVTTILNVIRKYMLSKAIYVTTVDANRI